MAKTRDMTVGSPTKLIFGFFMPLLFGLLFQQMYNAVDTVVVGRFLGVNALAGVGATGALNFLILGFCTGTCTGFAIPVAQKFGEHDFAGLKRYAVNAIMISVAFSLVVGLLVSCLCRTFLVWMNTPADIIDDAFAYLFVIFLGIPVVMLYNVLFGIIRSMGDSRTPVLYLVVASLINVALDLLLIVVFHTGVEGAAIATLLSRVAEFAVCLFCALRSRVIPLDLKALLRPGWEMLRRFVKYASPVMANELFWGLGNSLLTVILGHMTISVEFLAANAVMGNLNPLLRDTADFTHKLWDHLFIMSDFQLDVDSPYPRPSRQELTVSPRPMAYTQGRIAYKHYGKYVERMIRGLADERNPQTVARTVDNLARYMRTKSYEYNQEHPNNEVIVKDIKRMSGGAIEIDEVALNNLRSDYKQHFTARPQKGPQQRQQQRPQKNRNQQHGRNFSKNNGAHRNSSK